MVLVFPESGGLMRPADLTRRTGRPKRRHEIPRSRSPRGAPQRVSGDRLKSLVHRDSECFPLDMWTGGDMWSQVEKRCILEMGSGRKTMGGH